MTWMDGIHGRFVLERRVRILVSHLAKLPPEGARILDVGAGDGQVAVALKAERPDVDIVGIDTLVRPDAHIAVQLFDGSTIPFPDASFDAVMLVDVLHHITDPLVLLREARRVAKKVVIIKDHNRDGLFAERTLRFMDAVGNRRHGVALPYHYLSMGEWQRAFESVGLWAQLETRKLSLYPWPATWLFDRSLHFVARLAIRHDHSGGPMPDRTESVSDSMELTILLPCLNEAETIASCIRMAQSFLRTAVVSGEVIVADNGSTDGSRQITFAEGARLVSVTTRGYGAALLGGIEAARGQYVVMGDADGSYDLSDLMPFLVELRGGADLVMGNRFKGGIAPGAMPFSHRYIGNPVLSKLGRMFFSIKIGDFHSGLRGFRRDRIRQLRLMTTGMEFASEMIVKSALAGYKITEVATTLSKDGRSRPPHLRTSQDGWRHLRFLFMYSPRWLFLYPGLLVIAVGVAGIVVLLPGQVRIGSVRLDIHTFVAACMAVLIGLQSVTFAIVARRYATLRGLLPAAGQFTRLLHSLTPDRFLGTGAVIFVLSLLGLSWCVWQWISADFGPILDGRILRVLVLSFTGLAAGIQFVLAAFLSSLIEIPYRDDRG